LKNGRTKHTGVSYQARIAWLVLLIGVGLSTKFYQGWGAHWFNNSLGGVFYVVFWCLFWAFFEPKRRHSQIAIVVLGITSLLECLQLSRHPVLEWVRAYFIGRTLIGTTFAPWDFFYYVVGALLGYSWIKCMRRA